MSDKLGYMLIGLGFGVGGMAAASLLGVGFRVDDEGTTATTFDMTFGWGGLALCAVLVVAGGLIAGRNWRTTH